MSNSYYVKDDDGASYPFGLLVGPNNFQCLLTEPEDRTWYRDGAAAVDELNRLDSNNASIRSTLCEYQLKFWTLSYQNTKFFGALLGDDEDWEDE